MNLFKKASELQEKNIVFAMCTIINAQGSTPRHHAKMIVLTDGSIIGTIGGGPVEKHVVEDAIEAIANRQSGIKKYTLNSAKEGGLQMHCGGEMEVLIEYQGHRPKLMLVGAGHVNHAVYRMAEMLDFDIVVADDRNDFATESRYPHAIGLYCHEDIQKACDQAQIDAMTYVIIATKDCDEKALRAVINRGAAYVGVIGSRRKISIIRQHMEADGFTEQQLNALYWPIGLDLGGETPEEIAISMLAEVIKIKNHAGGGHLRDNLLAKIYKE